MARLVVGPLSLDREEKPRNAARALGYCEFILMLGDEL